MPVVSSVSRPSRSTWRRIICGGAVAALLAGYFSPAPSGQGDVTPPTLAAQSPAANATGVSTLISVRAVFSEPIQSGTLVMQLRNSASQLLARDGDLRRPEPDRDAGPDAGAGRESDLHRHRQRRPGRGGQHDDGGELDVHDRHRRLPGHRPAADRARRSHRDPVRRRREDLRGGEERANLRVRQPRGHDPDARDRSAHGGAQLLGPRHARHGAAPELSGHALHLRDVRATTRFPAARRRGGARPVRSAIRARRRPARPTTAASSPAASPG